MTHTTPDLSAGNSLPAVPMGKDVKIRERIDVPQREDYVPPVVPPLATPPVRTVYNADTLIPLLMDIHKFVEVNAVLHEHHKMADDLRRLLEGR